MYVEWFILIEEMHMKNNVIQNCPSCGAELHISQLKCPECKIEINGDFDLQGSLPLNLTPEEMEFVKLFIKFEGNLSKMGNEIGLNYASMKEKLRSVKVKLGLINEVPYPDLASQMEPGDQEDHLTASGEIIRKLNASSGVAKCKMLRGEPLSIWLTKEGVRNSGYPELICEWKAFDAILEKACQLGGKMYRGDSAAQSGAKIGDPGLEENTIDGFISMNFYDKKKGDSTIRRSTYYAAIMAWAGICENHRSEGRGGYILIKDPWLFGN